MRTIVYLGVLALLGACSDRAAPPVAPASAPVTSTASTSLSASGIGPIRFGMTLAQAEAATASKASLLQAFDPACSMVRFPTLPALRFMVEEGVVTRADAEPGVGNTLGVAFGDTLAQVRSKHPNAEVSVHKYDPAGHYVTFPGTDGRSAIILEESGGKVTRIRAGLQPSVAYVETCL